MGAGAITGFPLLVANLPTEMEIIIKRAGSIARFPLLQADLPTHVESLLLCAEVRVDDGGCAIFIAVTKVYHLTRTIHLGSAPLLSLPIIHTRKQSFSTKYEWEDTGTASVRTTDCVAD